MRIYTARNINALLSPHFLNTILLFGASLISCLQAWEPSANSMLTEWGAQVTPDNVWREYPRPMMQRKEWTNLNGLWDYAVTPKTRTENPDKWDGQILVPFAIESALSGVKKPFTPDDSLWYRRSLDITPKPGKRYLLHFEAVDYQATVWLNGKQVGVHSGGNLPFSFDVTTALAPGKNEMVVRVTDATDSAWQLHGKQTLNPHGIWYSSVSGIWQTVWMEEVAGRYIRDLKITPKIDGTVQVKIDGAGDVAAGEQIAKVTALLGGKQVAEAVGSSESITLRIPEPKLWSPDSPTLYDLQITLGDDKVESSVGLRETSVVKDANGHLRFHLNGKEIFHFGTLDQGWWPDGLLTPPSDAAMRSDLEFLKAAGFNTVRKHIKVEPRRYYHHCDKIGLLVWQDQVSSYGSSKNKAPTPAWTRLKPDPVDAQWPEEAHKQFMSELKDMIDTLHNHPSIVQWVPFNEAWGQHRTMDVGKWVVAYDPTRQINVASGGNFWPAGHIVDHHEYPHPAFPFDQGKDGRFDGLVKVIGEFGGHGYPVEGHLWKPGAKNWGYGRLPKNKEEWMERYKLSMHTLGDLRKQGIAAGIYTQTTDVEGEINGLITYDRKVRKVPAETLAAIHREAGLTD